MLDYLYPHVGDSTAVLLSLAIMLVSGFLLTRLTKLFRLPKVSGYIIAGILIGPGVFNFIPASIIEHMAFLSDLALAFIAFGVAKFFRADVFRAVGKSILIITAAEALAAGVLITLVMRFLFGYAWNFSLLLGAIATATAPASTMMTIRQYHAKGAFVNTLLGVVAFDDVICLLAFSISTAAVSMTENGGGDLLSLLLPLIYTVASIAVAVVLGFIYCVLLRGHTSDTRLILIVAGLIILTAGCSIFDISPLLACMVFGAVYRNAADDEEIFKQVDHFTPPIFLMFFVLSGMNLDITLLPSVGIVGVAYFLIRIAGKYLGARAGCAFVHSEPGVKKYLGLALIPQAGVAIGLSILGERIVGGELGRELSTIILSSSVLYELIGPAAAKFALFRSGDVPEQYRIKKKKESASRAGIFPDIPPEEAPESFAAPASPVTIDHTEEKPS